jgi:hypothetical protein
VTMAVSANGAEAGHTIFERAGLFVFEADLPPAIEYEIEISVSPTWKAPPDQRLVGVNVGMIRLVQSPPANP